ncbi:MAG: hypothetical protein OET18_00055 [Desulfobacterales bacterium]|jgi:hypothetical protein|nr:hypothetical protein [Desulfobacterales bacterium]
MPKDKMQFLKYYFWVFGLLNILIISFTVPLLFGDLLLWQPRNIPVEIMIGVIYFAMGIIMIFSASNPLSHKSFLDFVIIANILHAIVMVLFAKNLFHLIVDVIPIGLMGVLPLLFYPWGLSKFLRYRY